MSHSTRRHRVRYEVPGQARYLTCSTFHRAPVFAQPWARDCFARHLVQAREQLGFRLLAWVVMPDHFHLLILPDPSTHRVPTILRAIKEPTARQVLLRLREMQGSRLGGLTDARGDVRVWQRGGGYDRNLVTREAIVEGAKYIHANPVRKELCRRQEEWVWSSAAWYAGDRDGPVQIDAI